MSAFFGIVSLILFTPFISVAADYDLLILNAKIADGTGTPLVDGRVAVKDSRIVEAGPSVKGSATETIDARGKVVAPGFIDVHTHSEKICEYPEAENFLRMGVTTIVTGNCGGSRTDVAKFFQEIEETGVAVNVATLIGHNSVRRAAMGGSFIRPPKPEEMDKMRNIVDQAMADGAVGLSTGLIYNPGTFAKTEEIIELAKVASVHGGIYVSHMRSEASRIFQAIDELIRIAREADIRAQVSHIKVIGPASWGKSTEVLAVLDRARAAGLEITHDAYAYTASSTGLRQMIPDEALEGNRDDFRKRLADPEWKQRIVDGMRTMRERRGTADYSYAVIARFKSDPSLNGLTIPEAAEKVRGSSGLEDQVALILDIESRGGGSGIYHGMNEDDVENFLRHPRTMIASDGGPRAFGKDLTHPRSYGNNARVISRFVRELSVLKLEEAIRKMTSLPADTFRLEDRGVIRPGAFADLVIFDPEAVSDPSTFNDPHHYAEGFSDVIVNGGAVIRAGKLTGVLSGGALRPASK